ncbi:phosphatidylinositol N-acetylglucosaminyltransferase subunit Q [Anabrus simplex]|uniref:phosphatidylinositol N-acetylglucosaminyltransferase subunit Q n=1 Tax=Anabrus simplex TaxID=316456 RepID=UPI0035A272B1
MSTTIIFLPSSLFLMAPGNVYGTVQYYQKGNVNNFYILGIKSPGVNDENPNTNNQNIIGYFSKDNTPNTPYNAGVRNWVSLGVQKDGIVFYQVISNGENIDVRKPCRVISVVYDYQMFLESELLLQCSESRNSDCVDYFTTLMTLIRSNHVGLKDQAKPTVFGSIVILILTIFLKIVDSLLGLIVFMDAILKFSALGLKVHMFLQSMSWALHRIVSDKRVTLKVGNFIVATIIDMCTGVLLLYWLLSLLTSSPSQSLLDIAEVVVSTLRDLLKWIMGIPAGLKLNFAFNNMLGRFFLYHINLWWTFLVVAQPLLEFTFQIFLWFGQLGLTFQAAILADLLAIASFHVYCIYVYAARLYNLQVSGLIALWRLFLGRKHNPLRGRVDSCHYTADQLFIGTLAFTILLFLMPTTFIYYVVFAGLRLTVVGLGGLLTRIRFLLQILPVYSTCLWCLQPSAVSTSLHLMVRNKEKGKGNLLALSACPVASSWWNTMQHCVPDPVRNPPNVQWGTLLKNLVTGHLVYPV